MTSEEKQAHLIALLNKHNDERRIGSADIIKVVLSVITVLLTVLATIGTQGIQQQLSICTAPLKTIIILTPYPLLLTCAGFCIYHLHYALNSYNTKMLSLINNAFQASGNFDDAYNHLKSHNMIDHPALFKNSLWIIYSLFGLSLLVILLRVTY